MKLGNVDHFIRNEGVWLDYHVDELIEIGFDHSQKLKKYSYEQFRIAVMTYKLLYNVNNTFTIPYNFVVPNDSIEW